MIGITTHVLDVSLGRPATGVLVQLARWSQGDWHSLGEAHTDAEGRVRAFSLESSRQEEASPDSAPPPNLDVAQYRLRFDVERYFAASQRASFYGHVDVCFFVNDPDQHYHVPLLLSPFGYSTYRGR